MKLIVRDYIQSLKEREELDAILPDLLSELGFTVLSQPGRGTKQDGVDIAAVGKDDDGERKLFLLSVKQGNLTRKTWDDGTEQSFRRSLNEIRDAYIPSRIPQQYSNLRIVICLCFGGFVQEQVQAAVTGFIKERTTDRISYVQWNGEVIAELLLEGLLREKVLPEDRRSSLRKAVAMVDEPDVAYQHFHKLVQQLRTSATVNEKSRVRTVRQLLICAWILFVWARDVDNVAAAYRASELALLHIWDLGRFFIGKRTGNARSAIQCLHKMIELHVRISDDLLERNIFPYIGKKDCLSWAVHSRSGVDVNLKLFELLGIMALSNLWMCWFTGLDKGVSSPELAEQVAERNERIFQLIENNPTLFAPLCDHHAVEVSLVLVSCLITGSARDEAGAWLREMVHRIDFAVRTHGRYPCIFHDYRDLILHPVERSEEYRKEALAGSVLLPLLASWLAALGEDEAWRTLAELQQSELEFCTFQIWLPDDESEDQLYVGGSTHGVTVTDIGLTGGGEALLKCVADACRREDSFTRLSAWRTRYWPLILVACRHYRLPVPAHFWSEALSGRQEASS